MSVARPLTAAEAVEAEIVLDEGTYGLRYDKQGRVLEHSILGSIQDFEDMAGELFNAKLSSSSEKETVDERNIITIEDRIEDEKHANAFARWNQTAKVWNAQQTHIAETIGANKDNLAMHQHEKHRKKLEDAELIERSIPILQYDTGGLLGAEFWRLPEYKHTLPLTLTKTEQGQYTDVEVIGRPAAVLEELHRPLLLPRPPTALSRTDYYQQRHKQLGDIKAEFVRKDPDFLGLQVIGTSISKLSSTIVPDNTGLSVQNTTIRDISELEIEHVTRQPISPKPRTVPAFAVSWEKETRPSSNEIRLNLVGSCQVKSSTFVTLHNPGGTAIFYAWELIRQPNELNTKIDRTSRFFFSRTSGSILPGETKRVPVTFLSPNAGIYTESWRILTTPRINTPVVTLVGSCHADDTYKSEREKIEAQLEHNSIVPAIRKFVEALIESIEPTPNALLSSEARTIEQQFLEANPKLTLVYCQQRHVETLRTLREDAWNQWQYPSAAAPAPPVETTKPAGKPAAKGKESMAAVAATPEVNDNRKPSPPWNLQLQDITRFIDAVEDDVARGALSSRLSSIVAEMNAFHPELQQPIPSTSELCHSAISCLIDRLSEIMSVAHQKFDVPEKPFVVKQDTNDENSKTSPEKGDSKKPARRDSAKAASKAAAKTGKPASNARAVKEELPEKSDVPPVQLSEAMIKMRAYAEFLVRHSLSNAISTVFVSASEN